MAETSTVQWLKYPVGHIGRGQLLGMLRADRVPLGGRKVNLPAMVPLVPIDGSNATNRRIYVVRRIAGLIDPPNLASAHRLDSMVWVSCRLDTVRAKASRLGPCLA